MIEFAIKDEKMELNDQEIEDDEEDPVVKEIDVYLAKPLSNKIYILQYPIRPEEKNYENSKYLGARIKPKQNKLEIELELDTTNDNYSRVKGEQFALNVDGKQTASSLNASKQGQKPEPTQQKYYKSHLMDKQVLTSTNASLGQMNRLYHLGLLKENKLHLTSIKGILQMKPSFEYFDIYENKVKNLKENENASKEADYSTEEELENELEKAELVTLKYSLNNQHQQQQQQSQEQDQNWINLKFNNLSDNQTKNLKQSLLCQNQDNIVKLEISNEEFIHRLIDANYSNNPNE